MLKSPKIRTPEICIGIPLSLWLNTNLHMCKVKAKSIIDTQLLGAIRLTISGAYTQLRILTTTTCPPIELSDESAALANTLIVALGESMK